MKIMDKIGQRIRTKRVNLKLNLKDLATKVGVTPSCLSQIEKGKSFPSIITLKHIANELQSSVGELIGEHETLVNNPVIRKHDRKIVDVSENGAELHLLSHHDEHKKMETFYVLLQKGSDTQAFMKQHSGEEFIYVIEGKIELLLNEQVYTLEAGDTALYNSNTNHTVKNINADKSRLIWIITPPNI
jgi:transcriptional regulator with XRE-family HTH domain